MSIRPIETAEGDWLIPFDGYPVLECHITSSPRLDLVLGDYDMEGGAAKVYFYQGFELQLPGLSHWTFRYDDHPHNLAPALDLIGLTIRRAVARREGSLEIELSEGYVLRAGASRDGVNMAWSFRWWTGLIHSLAEGGLIVESEEFRIPRLIEPHPPKSD